MYKNYLVYAVITLVAIGGIGFLVTNETSTTGSSATNDSVDARNQLAPEDTTPVSQNLTADEMAANATEAESPAATKTAGTYQDYDPALVAASTADTIVLFFHATWCPSCRALHNDITNNVAAIPPGVEIYRADFDIHTELRRQNNVTLQHSVMTIDTDGIAISNITHPLNLSALLASLQ